MNKRIAKKKEKQTEKRLFINMRTMYGGNSKEQAGFLYKKFITQGATFISNKHKILRNSNTF